MNLMKEVTFVTLLAIAICSCKIDAQELGQKSTTANSDKGDESAQLTILAQPKSIRPFKWKDGEKVTIGVRCVSAKDTRVVGVVTGIQLMESEIFPNRVALKLRGEKSSIQKLFEAAKRSELCFEVMPFNEEHRKILAAQQDLLEFLKEHSEYRVAGLEDWGLGGNGVRLSPPTNDEMPQRPE